MKNAFFLKIAAIIAVLGLVSACAPTADSSVVQNKAAASLAEAGSSASAKTESAGKQKRSKKEIMAVFDVGTQNRSRPIYNRYLRKRPHFSGKIVLKVRILPSGDVESAEIVSATTDYEEFEKAILEDFSQWKYESGDYEKCTVTVPLTFSE